MQRHSQHPKKDRTVKDQKSIIDTLIANPDVTEVKMIISSKNNIKTQGYRVNGKHFFFKITCCNCCKYIIPFNFLKIL